MIVSHAQNFEDVILWRALRTVQKGFYIDIGAHDPVIDSVSLCFYERGWRGVHVEPVKESAEKISIARPDELVLCAAVTSSPVSDVTFYTVQGTGLSTGIKSLAQKYEEEGRIVSESLVRTITLSDLLETHGAKEIHWLKIDAEGMEHEILESWGNSTARPWIVIVESTAPNTQAPTHQHWEEHLQSRDYECVYFDGLNRFYLSSKHKELRVFFGPGPNFFDDFVLAPDSWMRRNVSGQAEISESVRSGAFDEGRRKSTVVDDLAVLDTQASIKSAAEKDAIIATLRIRLEQQEQSERELVAAESTLIEREAFITRLQIDLWNAIRLGEKASATSQLLQTELDALRRNQSESIEQLESLAKDNSELRGALKESRQILNLREREVRRLSTGMAAKNVVFDDLSQKLKKHIEEALVARQDSDANLSSQLQKYRALEQILAATHERLQDLQNENSGLKEKQTTLEAEVRELNHWSHHWYTQAQAQTAALSAVTNGFAAKIDAQVQHFAQAVADWCNRGKKFASALFLTACYFIRRAFGRPVQLQGHVDGIVQGQLCGWVRNPYKPDEAVRLELWIDGKMVGNHVADQYREDLEKAGIGTGRFSYCIPLSTTDKDTRSRVELRVGQAVLFSEDLLLVGRKYQDEVPERNDISEFSRIILSRIVRRQPS